MAEIDVAEPDRLCEEQHLTRTQIDQSYRQRNQRNVQAQSQSPENRFAARGFDSVRADEQQRICGAIGIQFNDVVSKREAAFRDVFRLLSQLRQ